MVLFSSMARLSVSTLRRDGAALLRDGLLDQDAEAGGGGSGNNVISHLNYQASSTHHAERIDS